MKTQSVWMVLSVGLAACGSNGLVSSEDAADLSTVASLGCFKDEATRDLSHVVTLDSASNTIQSCIGSCADAGYAYAGVQYATQCFCGDSYGHYGAATDCNMKCSGNSSEVCGGTWANSVYSTGAAAGHYVELAWVAPTTRADGTALTNLAGFRLYQGVSSGAYGPSQDLGILGCAPTGVGCSPSYRVSGVDAGTLYFAVTAYDTAGMESVLSGPASADVP